MFKKTLSLLAAAAIIGGATAAESLHLTNCGSSLVSSDGRSAIFYYADDSKANGSNSPTDQVFANDAHTYVHWEGNTITRQFNSGVTVSVTIDSAAEGYQPYTRAGSANNGYRDFTCYRDNAHVIYHLEGTTCYSLYYCL